MQQPYQSIKLLILTTIMRVVGGIFQFVALLAVPINALATVGTLFAAPYFAGERNRWNNEPVGYPEGLYPFFATLAIWVVLAIVLGVIFTLHYNRFRRLREATSERKGNLAASVKRRLTMVTQLTELVREFSKREENIQVSVAANSGIGTAELVSCEMPMEVAAGAAMKVGPLRGMHPERW